MSLKGRIWWDGDHGYMALSAVVAVSPEVAFDYLADITRHPEWSSDPLQVTPLSPGPAHVGSRYRTVARSLGKDWESEVEITALERPGRFEFTSVGGITHEPEDEPQRHLYTFSPVPDGTLIELRRRFRGMKRRALRDRVPMVLLSAIGVFQPLWPRGAAGKALLEVKRLLEAGTR